MTDGKIINASSPQYEEAISALTEDIIDIVPYAAEYLMGNKKIKDISITVLANVKEVRKKDISNTIGIVSIEDQSEVEVGTWAGALRLFNLFQFLHYGFFTSTSGLENKEYDLLEYNIDQESSLDEWSVIYEEVLDEAKALVKLLSKGSLPLPEVGYELCDDKGMIVSEFELAWPKYKIAVTLDEPIEVGEWELFAVEQSEAIIERMKQKVGV